MYTILVVGGDRKVVPRIHQLQITKLAVVVGVAYNL